MPEYEHLAVLFFKKWCTRFQGFDGEFKSPPLWVQQLLCVRDRKAEFEEDSQGSVILKIHTAAEQWSEVGE